jgi:selenium metabolism protein YedF
VGKVIIIQSETLGRGDDTLGALLMANFLRLSGDSDKKPEKLILWNTGVRLVCEGSQVLEHMKKLETVGVEILACTTCLEYFDLKDKQLVGKPTTMAKSVEAMMNQDVVSL